MVLFSSVFKDIPSFSTFALGWGWRGEEFAKALAYE